MAITLSASQIATLTGAYSSHFQIFSHNRTRTITIIKEPVKTVVTNTNAFSPAYGYGGNDSQPTNFTYTHVSGIFPAMITYNLDQKTEELEEVKSKVGVGKVRVKVEQDARDFIEDGRKNVKVEFDGKAYNINTFDGVQNFQGLKYFCYFLEATK
ncbi:MAG: hypothetical protein Q8O88_04975 [bacterium]|nr:hypothetical protein [bacterium]